MTSNGYRWK